MTTKELGNLGEKLAREYLVKKGYNILGKNYWITFGEIDIIAQKRWRLFARWLRPIHFVEVKTIVSSAGFFPEEHVNYKKKQKLRALAQIWLQKNKYKPNYPYQIDIAAITVTKETRIANLHYFFNAIKEN